MYMLSVFQYLKLLKMALLSRQLYEICSGWELFHHVGIGDTFIHAMVQLTGPLPDQ